MNTLKRCRQCENLKALKQFHADARTADGYHYYCKDCRRANGGHQPQATAKPLQVAQRFLVEARELLQPKPVSRLKAKLQARHGTETTDHEEHAKVIGFALQQSSKYPNNLALQSAVSEMRANPYQRIPYLDALYFNAFFEMNQGVAVFDEVCSKFRVLSQEQIINVKKNERTNVTEAQLEVSLR